MKYEFIYKHESNYPVEKMCKYLKISKNSYYKWLTTKDKIRQKASLIVLKERIQYHFQQSKSVYGSYRIKKALERENIYYSRAYIAVWMQKMGLKSVLRRKYVITTNSNHSYPIAENKLNREFTSYQLGEKWVSDITYVRVNDNWNYLTTIMDLADRKIVGWQLSEDMTVENTIYKAWIKARENRNISDNFIFHSDRGVQYASKRMTCIFSFNRKITQSMSRKGNCWDNAVAESFFKTIKNECLNRYSFSSILSLYRCIDEYINWYNTERLHSSLGYKTPLEMEIYLKNLNQNVA
ncbi:transposase [Flavobacterium covae]|nr:transposase [Flavobacterium covae]